LEAVTERIIGCAFRVANALGHGFVEKVYENALAHEMRKSSASSSSVESWSFATT
jgi:GxxExxY protein